MCARWAGWIGMGLGVAVALGQTAAPEPADDALPAADQVAFADGLFARGLHDLALREYMRALRETPGHPAMPLVLFRIGECYRAQTNAVAANLFYRRVMEEHPAHPARFRAEFRRAELLSSEEKWADALAQFRALVAATPPPDIAVAARYHMGHALQRLDRAAEAEREFRAVLEQPGEGDYAALAALELAALRRRAKQDDDEQSRLYALAIERAPTDRLAGEAWFQQAELALRRGQAAAADTAYGTLRDKFSSHPRAAEARLAAAWAAFRNGRFADALADTFAPPPTPPAEEPDWLYLRANAQRQVLDPAAAEVTYADLAKRFPAHPLAAMATYERALLMFQGRRFAEALALLQAFPEAAAEAAGVGGDRLWLLAEASAAAGDMDRAVQFYRQLADRDDPARGADALYRLARLLSERGETAGAAELYRRLADRHPKHEAAAPALFSAGAAWAQLDRHEEAVTDWARLLRDHGDSPLAEEAAFQKALSELRLGRAAVARETLSALLRKHPQGRFAAEARLWTAVVLDQAGELELAEQELRAGLTEQPKPELDRQIRFRLAGVLQRRGKTPEAADLIQGLLDTPVREEMTPALLEWLVRLRLDQQRAGDAAAAVAALRARAGDDPAFRLRADYLEGRAALAQGRRPEAIAAFARAAAGEPGGREGIEALLVLGDLAREDARFEEAVTRYSSAAERAGGPEDVDLKARALYGLGLIHEARGEDEEALRYYLGLAILFDDPALSPESLWRAAAAFQRQGQPVRRDQILQELRERYADSDWARKPLP
jgi:tetratricopeptide (TPR) repeat protein